MAEFRYRKSDTFTLLWSQSLFLYRLGKCVLAANSVNIYAPPSSERCSEEVEIPLEAASLILSLWGHTPVLEEEPKPVDYKTIPKPEWGYEVWGGAVIPCADEASARAAVAEASRYRKLVKFSS